MTHNKSSGRVSPENTAELLIDHQIGTIKFAMSTPRDEIIRNTRALARTAVETGMPLVLSTSLEDKFQGPLLQDFVRLLPLHMKNGLNVQVLLMLGFTSHSEKQ